MLKAFRRSICVGQSTAGEDKRRRRMRRDSLVIPLFRCQFSPSTITSTKKGGSDALVGEGGIIEVAKYGLLVDFLHGQIVV